KGGPLSRTGRGRPGQAGGADGGGFSMTVVSDPNTPVAKPRSRRSWLLKVGAVLAIFGPGLISANAGNDAGGILTYASAGSQFGYRMLFLMVLVTVGLVVVQEM